MTAGAVSARNRRLSWQDQDFVGLASNAGRSALILFVASVLTSAVAPVWGQPADTAAERRAEIEARLRELKKQIAEEKEGPFGLYMGMSRSQIEETSRGQLEEVTTYTHRTTRVPKPHSAFSYYLLVVAPNAGLCEIHAFTPSFETNIYGDTVKSRFEELQGQLRARYGYCRVVDRLREGSLWKEPEDWTMGLLKEERDFFAAWTTDDSVLPDELDEVLLRAVGRSRNTALLHLAYRFSNREECEREKQDKEKEVL